MKCTCNGQHPIERNGAIYSNSLWLHCNVYGAKNWQSAGANIRFTAAMHESKEQACSASFIIIIFHPRVSQPCTSKLGRQVTYSASRIASCNDKLLVGDSVLRVVLLEESRHRLYEFGLQAEYLLGGGLGNPVHSNRRSDHNSYRPPIWQEPKTESVKAFACRRLVSLFFGILRMHASSL